MAEVLNFVVKNAEQSRDSMLRTLRVCLVRRGVSNPNVGPTSDYFARFQAIANEIEVAGANCVISIDELMPDTASIIGLSRWAQILNLPRNTAAGSYGYITLRASASTFITEGSSLVDDLGQRFESQLSRTYDPGTAVPVRALVSGSATNHDAGDSLTWVNAPPFADDKAVVADGGLVDGVDEEDVETWRARIIARIQDPTGAGNNADIIEDAEKSAPNVQKAFAYACAEGPATVHVACVAAPTDTSKSRAINPVLMDAVVKPYVIGQNPEHAGIRATNTIDENADVAFAIAIPFASSVAPAGGSSGWLDATPWPIASTGGGAATVSAITSTTKFDVQCPSAPTVGVSRIAWLSIVDWKVTVATVTSSSPVAGGYQITVDQPLVGLVVGAHIWPAAKFGQKYADAVLAHFKKMGPGEKTSSPSLLTRAYRVPVPSVAWPYSLGSHMLRALIDSSPEIEDASFVKRNGVYGSVGVVNPTVPGVITDAPRCFVPRHISFYPAT